MPEHERPALKHYGWQAIGVFIYMAIVIFILDCVSTQSFLWAIAITSIASSACIVFTRPHSVAADPKRMIGSYVLSFVIGFVFFHMVLWMTPLMGHRIAVELLSACAVALFVFLMARCEFQHPPAAGVVFGFTIEPWNNNAVLVILASVIVLIIIHIASKAWMKDLLK